MFSLLLALAASVGAMADDVSGLTVEYITEQSEYIQAVKSIGRISFSGGTVVVRFTDGARLEIGALADIEQILFGNVDETKVAQIPTVAVEPDPTVPPKGEGSGDTTPSTGGDTTPSTGGDSTPSTGGDTTPSTGGNETPSTGGDTTPSTGGDETPSTPSTGDDNTSTPINQVSAQKLVVSVSPNPTADHISISGVEKGEVVRIFNAEGRIVLSGAQTEFDLGNLPKGVYLLQAGSEIVKIIKK